MPRHIILLLASSFLFAHCIGVTPDDRPAPDEDPDAYEVYAAILPMEFPWRAHARTLVISSETRGYGMCLRPEGEFQRIMEPAISDFVRLNEKTWHLQRRFTIEKPYELIAARESEQVGWEKFYKMHPDSGGWIELSAVGFNGEKTIAVVYAAHHCGNGCAGGSFYVLQKKAGKWLLLDWKGNTCAWVA